MPMELFHSHNGQDISVAAVCDGGDQGCGGGLLLLMLQAMKRLEHGAVLEVRSTDPGVREVVANAAVASGKQTMVFVSSEGVHLAAKGKAEKIAEEGFQPMSTLLQNFLAAGGSLWVCSPCFKKRGYTDSDLIEGATIVGGAKLVEFLSNDGTGVSY